MLTELINLSTAENCCERATKYDDCRMKFDIGRRKIKLNIKPK
mgnify:CR=1 FL=1